jgi:SAM-dependent methyltransferase
MLRYFDNRNNRLVYVGNAANNSYWDYHWNSDHSSNDIKFLKNRLVIKHTRKYLPPKSRILEGGCGRGDNVYYLNKSGYDAYGVDYAIKTVQKTNKYAPEIKISCQDVRKLQFNDNFFDGYWSLGVIEHFYEGYNEIILESKRVLKKNGYLFIGTPTLSSIRRLKANLGIYPIFKENDFSIKNFYQFALNDDGVIKNFTDNGFIFIDKSRYDGIKGLKDEINLLQPTLQKLYDSSNFYIRITKYIFNIFIASFAGHMTLFVFQNKNH